MRKVYITLICIFCILLSSISWAIWTIFLIKNYWDRFWIDNKPIVLKEETIKTEKITSVSSLQTSITKIAKDISPSVVSIVIKKNLTIYRQDPFWFFQTSIWTVKSKVWWWTWFFISKDWKIITNKHVIEDEDAEYTVITSNWTEYDAKVLAIDPVSDLAIIQISLDKIYVPLEIIWDNDELNIWQFAITVWNSLAEYQNSVSLWVVSGKNRTISINKNTKLSGLIQTDAAINPWNSWGPLINIEWEVIWINTAIVSWAEWIWFAIPLTKNKINYLLDSIEKYWAIKKPSIWINYIINSPWIQKELWLSKNYWAYISDNSNSVFSWSSADKAWLKPWDLILEVDWQKINLENSLNSSIQTKIPGDSLKLKILWKDWKEKEVKLILWEW